VAVGLAALRAPLLPKEVTADSQLYLTAGKAAYASMAGDFGSAQAALNELIERFPKAHYVHYLEGCFLLAKQPEAAIAELRRELEITPGSGAANAMLAWVLLERNDIADAHGYAEAAAANDPALPLAQYVWGRCLLEQGKLQPALEHLQLAEKRDATNLETHMSLATAYARAARPAEARQERLQTLQLWKASEARANP
jgi:predicted Zn-dependent protease